MKSERGALLGVIAILGGILFVSMAIYTYNAASATIYNVDQYRSGMVSASAPTNTTTKIETDSSDVEDDVVAAFKKVARDYETNPDDIPISSYINEDRLTAAMDYDYFIRSLDYDDEDGYTIEVRKLGETTIWKLTLDDDYEVTDVEEK